VGFWSKLFGAKTRTSKLSGDSPYLPKKKDEVEVIFAKLFTQKGGKFIYSEDGKSSDHYFKLILEENHWKNENVLCFDKNLSDRFHISCQPLNIDANEFKVFLISCEYLIANKGSILICNHQLKDFKLDKLPPYIIVFSGLDNFVNDVSEGMTNIKNKYSDRLPSNITTLNVKNSTDEKDFLSYGNSAKSLYLLLQES
jgi:L-lactate utilization protein LutC